MANNNISNFNYTKEEYDQLIDSSLTFPPPKNSFGLIRSMRTVVDPTILTLGKAFAKAFASPIVELLSRAFNSILSFGWRTQTDVMSFLTSINSPLHRHKEKYFE